MPFRIRGYEARQDTNELILVSLPIEAELQPRPDQRASTDLPREQYIKA